MEAKYLRTSHFSAYWNRRTPSFARSSALWVPSPVRQANELLENLFSNIGSRHPSQRMVDHAVSERRGEISRGFGSRMRNVR